MENAVSTIKEVADFWGDKLPMMAMEEAGEFIQAVSKYERNPGDEQRANLIAEMADMMISIDALRVKYGITLSEVSGAMSKKLEKKY